MLLYQDSKDSGSVSAGIVVQTGRKWRAQEGLDIAELQPRHRALVGTVTIGQAGLGAVPQPRFDKDQGKDR